MSDTTSIKARAITQLALVVAVVLGIGYLMRWRADAHEAESAETSLPTRLTISGTAADSYPSEKFNSAKKWKKYLSAHGSDAGNETVSGTGTIGDYTVSIDCILRPDGTMVGRYHNNNGVDLDLNGYIDSATGSLLITLGHGKNMSDWKLRPSDVRNDDGSFKYEGTWGRKHKPSVMSISIKNKE